MDVLVLVEITPAAVERLRVAGLDTLLPESVGRTSQDAGGTIVRSRPPLLLTLTEPASMGLLRRLTSRSSRYTARLVMSCCAQFTRNHRASRRRRTGGPASQIFRPGANDSRPQSRS